MEHSSFVESIKGIVGKSLEEQGLSLDNFLGEPNLENKQINVIIKLEKDGQKAIAIKPIVYLNGLIKHKESFSKGFKNYFVYGWAEFSIIPDERSFKGWTTKDIHPEIRERIQMHLKNGDENRVFVDYNKPET
jgi:hypothetical protein